MITDTDKRLGAAVHELRDLVVGFILYSSLSLSSRRFTGRPSYSQQIQAKADPVLAEAQELLNAEEEMEAATL